MQPTASEVASLVADLADLAKLAPRIQISTFAWSGTGLRVQIEDAGDRVAFLKLAGITDFRTFSDTRNGAPFYEGLAGFYHHAGGPAVFVEVYGTARTLEAAA